MERLVRYLSERVTAGLCIDSTEPAVLERALRASPGSTLINSINLEKNGDKARRICGLAREYGCAVIALPIDESGMATTVDQKLALARRLVELACGECGLPPHWLFIDPLVFTLATGDPASANAAVESLAALARLKREFPFVQTVMGVSNVSFGLKPAPRRVLNNLLLHYAAAAGLDAAIFNPLHRDTIAEYAADIRGWGEDVLFNRHGDALERFIAAFESPAGQKSAAGRDDEPLSLPLAEQLRMKVINRDRRRLPELMKSLLDRHGAESILNDMLLPAMARVGEMMAAGEMILPFVLQAAEVMKEALSILEPHLQKESAGSKGSIILATVYGDIHDIGKNLVASILKNQGFKVLDLGKQVPVESVIEAVQRENPDAIGLSALLVTTSREMAVCVRELDRLGLRLPVLIGGAAVNRQFANRIAEVESGRTYAGGVYFAKDAFEAAAVLTACKERRGPAPIDKRDAVFARPIQAQTAPAPRPLPAPAAVGESAARLPIHDGPVEPPFWGTGEILTWETATLVAAIDKERLFKGYWRGGNLAAAEFERAVLTDFEPALESIVAEVLRQGLIEARGYYGFFPVFTDDEMLFLLDPSDFHTELAAYRLPRVKGRSIADYFLPEGDLLGVQIVTIGAALGSRCRHYLQQEHKYTLGFYLNGLGNFLTEYLAERVTIEIRRSLFLQPGQGMRYSFGFPGLPGVEEQKTLFELLGAEERLGIRLTPGYQMDPEHSTIGIFTRHAEAQYLTDE
jgi:5-methyltetrahydrofolate--homocysteine methyltransferase